MEKLNLSEEFASFDEQWSSQLAGEFNGQAINLLKVEGGDESDWNRHEDADELVLAISGEPRVEFRNESDVGLQEGELVIVPRGVEHRLVAEKEAEILLFDPIEGK